jgi:hypothetical protein
MAIQEDVVFITAGHDFNALNQDAKARLSRKYLCFIIK